LARAELFGINEHTVVALDIVVTHYVDRIVIRLKQSKQHITHYTVSQKTCANLFFAVKHEPISIKVGRHVLE